jgi:hypothetical protein
MSKKILTNKEIEILQLILTFRFINSKQIQRFLGHKDHRRVNAWLKDLTQKEYIVRAFKPIFGTLTKPAVYNLAAKGRAYIKNNYCYSIPYLKRLGSDKDRSKAFHIKCQLTADCFLILFEDQVGDFSKMIKEWLTVNSLKLLSNRSYFFTPAFYAFLTEDDCILLPQLKPDAYCYKKTSSGITHAFYFCLDSYVPRLILNYLLKHIFEVLSEEYWEKDDVKSLKFYLICPNNQVIIYFRRLLPSFLERYYARTTIFYFATRNQLYQKRDKGKEIKWITISSED